MGRTANPVLRCNRFSARASSSEESLRHGDRFQDSKELGLCECDEEGKSASVKNNAHSKNREGFDMEDLGSVRNTSSNEDDGVKALLCGRAAAQVYTCCSTALQAKRSSAPACRRVIALLSPNDVGANGLPRAPTGLTATASSSSAMGLSWTAVTPPANCSISSYPVYGSTTSGFTPSASNLIASGVTGNTYTNT